MSEPPGWSAPGQQPGPQPGPQSGQPPQWGQPAPQQWGQPGQEPSQQAGQQPGQKPGQQPGPQGGWGQPQVPGGRAWAPPAPRPGIVPLRPLTLVELWDGAFQAIRTNPKPLLGSAAVVVVIVTLAQLVLPLLLLGSGMQQLEALGSDPNADPAEVFGELGGLLPGLLGGSLVGAVLTLVAVSVLSGVVTVSVSTAVLGRRTAWPELWRRVRSRLWPLVGVAVLASLAPVVAALVLLAPGVALVAGGAVSGSDGSLVVGVLLLLGGILLTLVVGLFLATRLLLAPAALMLEGQGVGGALKRAWRLSRRGFWRLLGIWLLTTAIISAVVQVFAVPFNLLGQLVGGVVGVDSSLYFPVTLGIASIGTALASVVVYPLQAAVTALQYVDQRMRQEGLDVELARAAEQ